MKKSIAIPLLVILGTTIVLSSKETVDLTQQTYQSKEDCEQDWGNSERCTPSSSSIGHSSLLWHGPRYYWDRSLGKPVAINADGSERVLSNTRINSSTAGVSSSRGITHTAGSISRGGFGSFSHGFSGGG